MLRIWTLFWLLVVAVVATFAVMNWQVLSAQTALDFVAMQITAPLGLVMLGAMIGLGLLFLIFLVWLETKALVEFSRASRTATGTDSKAVAELERQLSDLREETSQATRQVLRRFEEAEQAMRKDIERASEAIGSRVDKHFTHAS